MKLPNYLTVLLVITLGMVIWTLLSDNCEPEISLSLSTQRPKDDSLLFFSEEFKEEDIIELFPAKKTQEKKSDTTPKPASEKKAEPVFPLQVVGAWWENGERIVILSNTEENILLCNHCHKKGQINPGDMIIPAWKLITLADDHLVVRSVPEQTTKRIELGDLITKPAR